MKIQKVDTKSFAISEGAEKRLESSLSRGAVGGALNKALFSEETEVTKGYLPLAKYKAARMEEIHKGVVGDQKIFETRENYFYVDLSTAEIYVLEGHRIKRLDILQKLLQIPTDSVALLGQLMRRSFMYEEGLDKKAIFDLAQFGYVSAYKSSFLMFFKGVWEEMNPEEQQKTVVKDRIKAAVHIPPFNSKDYDLSAAMEESNTADEGYSRDAIRFPIDTISTAVGALFDAKVSLAGMTFMPYVSAHYKREGQHKTKSPDKKFPVCFYNEHYTKKKGGVKLKPISLSTSIGVGGSVPLEASTIDFSDIGGMDEVKKEIREALLLPLQDPALAKEFGKKAGGAILLYGPPGCGKSYIARATIGEVGLPFFNVNISEIVGKGAAVEAESLHDVFAEASKSAPAVIFFDEIDAIGGRREGKMGYAEKMEIDQFLMEMDGVESLGNDVLIIAATNAPWNLDPALRRSMRFTRQIFIPPPDAEAREKIFAIHLKGKPISENVNVKELAEVTENYSSSDIKAICDRASEIPWEEALAGAQARKIDVKDFAAAINKQKSSLIPWFKMAYKEIRERGEEKFFEDFSHYILKYGGGVDAIEKPEIKFADVGGMELVKEEIRKMVIYPMQHPEVSQDYQKDVGGAVLLYGPPGCGKTYIARATAGECGVSFFNIKLTDILSEKTGESERNIQEIFERASRNAPAILFFDEIDAIAGRRDQVRTESGKRMIDAFLTELDGFKKTKGLVILAATNAPWGIDPALRRSERFTQQIFITPPDEKAREQIFGIHTRGKPVAADIDYQRLAEMTEGYSSSDIKAICDRAVEIPWSEALKDGRERRVTMADFVQVITSTKNSLSPWYASASKQIKESGEEEFYKELTDNITKYRALASKPSSEDFVKVLSEEKKRLVSPPPAGEDVRELKASKDEIEKKIDAVRRKYYKRELDENMFKEILGDYEKQLIELDVKMEILKSKKAAPEEAAEAQALERGQQYLIEEKGTDRSVELFLKEAEVTPALWISRTNPEKLKAEYHTDEKKIKVLWLTGSVVSGDIVSPMTPQLFAVITDFMAKNDREVILLEGLEYLITQNGFQVVLNMIQGLKDKLSMSNTILLMPLATETLSERERVLLEKETQLLD